MTDTPKNDKPMWPKKVCVPVSGKHRIGTSRARNKAIDQANACRDAITDEEICKVIGSDDCVYSLGYNKDCDCDSCNRTRELAAEIVRHLKKRLS